MKKIIDVMLLLTLILQLTMFSGSVSGQRIIPLSKLDWKFIGIEPQQGTVTKPDLKDEGWLPIHVPGDINASLLEHGKVPNPHYDTQARELYWITAKEWWYALSFDADADTSGKTVLVLEGVDGIADIWLNGEYMGIMKNAFYHHRFNIRDKLKEKGNILYIRFQSVNELLGGERLDELKGWNNRRGFLRKSQFNFGWDWSLPLPSIGLSGDVYIENGINFKLVDQSIRTFKSGRVDFDFEVSPETKKAGYYIRININGHGTEIEKTLHRDTYKSYISIQIPDPHLWYPNGYGEPNLYNYSVSLVVNDEVVDFRKGRFGIREVETREMPFSEEAGPGFSFEVLVNGEPVFCKGSNWIPCEIWPATTKPEQYEFYLKKAKDANFNMLRVWGGGIYEKDRFYELCDELGIMVWQDFMFAGSAGFPVDLLRDEIIKEARYQIARLRNHPCIVLWCGINEDVYSWRYPLENREAINQADNEGYEKKADRWNVNRYVDDPIIFTMILRGMVSRFGLGVPYVESSPQAPHDDYGNMPNSGNSHISCWKTALFGCGDHPENWRKHFEEVCSFNSEFCIQGPANMKMIKSFLAPQNQWPPNDAWIYHIQRGHANLPHFQQTLFIAGATFGRINSLQEYIKYGQALHVEQTRAEYESARRDRPNNGGTMSWMYNDCWPTSNWSIIDYYWQEKPAYYAAKRACEPVLPIIFERKGNIEFFLGNDTLSYQLIRIEYGQENLNGENVWSESKTFEISPNSTFKFDSIGKDKLSITRGDYFYIDAWVKGHKLPRVIYFPDGWKEIQWPEKPVIKLDFIEQVKDGDQWISRVKISSDKFVRLCHILLREKYENQILPVSNELRIDCSDNYFDLSAGGEHTITVKSVKKLTKEDLYIGHWYTEWE